jgi:single-stranded-DNA-specific exonuclease
VPNRFEYGYGLTPEIVELTARDRRPTSSSPSTTASPASTAWRRRARGIDVVVTDHHLPGDALPDARVIVNPNQPECGFPSKHLAGVGVVFYVLLALRAELRRRGVFDAANQPKLDNLLDLVALGTVADVVKLDTNNRILVAQGLKRMRAGRMHAGVAALFRVAGREARSASPFDLGFALGPRLNAAGRLEDMSLGIECLVTDDEDRAWADRPAAQRDQPEAPRDRGRDAGHGPAAPGRLQPADASTIAVFDDGWHQGVIGIVASRLKEKFYRPTITFAPAGDGWIKGSGRSIPGFHLRDALDLVSKRVPGLIDKFGGHAMAAGLTIRAEHFDAFPQAFEAVGRPGSAKPSWSAWSRPTARWKTTSTTVQFIELLDGQVWGQGFAPPVFCDEFRVVSQRILKDAT